MPTLDAIPKNEMLYDELQRLLKTNPLTWTSETDSELVPVRLPWYRVMRWKQEADGKAEQRLEVQEAMQQGAWWRLKDMFQGQRVVSIRRATKKPGVYELMILAYFGWWYVGFKCEIVET